MSRLLNFINKTSLQTKLVLYFGILTFLTVTIVAGRAYVLAAETIESSMKIDHASALQLARNLGVRMAGMGIIVSLVLILAGYLLARQITRPLRVLLSVASRIAAGDLNVTAPLLSMDEVGILSQTVNEMTAAIRLTLAGLERKLGEQKQLEQEREKFIVELEAKNAELERFTYTISHELKAPLVTIRGFLGLVERDALAGNLERLRADMARITQATDRMQRQLSELLELSRVGRLMNAPQSVPFEMLVREALELVRERIEVRRVQVDIAPDLPIVHGDRARLVEVVQNLVDNAAKYMGDQPNPRIEIGQRGTDADGKPILFVRDNGLGIEPQYHQRIFGLFNKLDAKTDGTGVGLALVKRIVEVHGGRIWVESQGSGQGSTFCFTLPDVNDEIRHRDTAIQEREPV